MATIATAQTVAGEAAPASFAAQLRFFLWLSSGMFGMSALALAFLDYWIAGAGERAAGHFLAAVAAAALFGLATVLRLGPSEA